VAGVELLADGEVQAVPVSGLAAVDLFVSTLDALSDLDPTELGDGQLHRALMAVVDAAPVIEAASARLLDAWRRRNLWAEDGSRSAAARSARDAHCSRPTANRLVKRADDLHAMPVTSQAFGFGQINADHVDLLRAAAGSHRSVLFERDEAMLVEACQLLAYFEARQMIAYWISRADAELERDVAAPRYHDRHASWRPGLGGEIDIRATLDPVGGAEFTASWGQIEHELYLADQHSDVATRSLVQRRADALVEMARRASAHGSNAESRVLVTVVAGEHSLSRLCELSNGAVIAPGELVPHLDRIDVHTIVFDGPFTPIVASKQRTFTGALRRAIEVRDLHCQHPDGDRDPIGDCDIDHIIPRADGGETSLENGRLLSRHRNRNLRVRDLTAADVTVYDDDPTVVKARERLAALIAANGPPSVEAA